MHNIAVNYWLHTPVPYVCIINFLWRHVWRHRGHLTLPKFFVNNSWPNWARALGKAQLYSEWAAESHDMQHDHPRSRYWPGQPWPDLDLWSTWNLTFSKQKVYHSTRLGKTNTMVLWFVLCNHLCKSYSLKTKPLHLGHWPDLWHHRLTWNLKFRCQLLRLATPDTFVFSAKL